MGAFPATRAEWGEDSADALTWFLSPHRTDFIYRTGIFEETPDVERPSAGFLMPIGKPVRLYCHVGITRSSYYAEAKLYARATYHSGCVPKLGYFGFIPWENEEITVEDIRLYPNQPSPVTPAGCPVSNKVHVLSAWAGEYETTTQDHGTLLSPLDIDIDSTVSILGASLDCICNETDAQIEIPPHTWEPTTGTVDSDDGTFHGCVIKFGVGASKDGSEDKFVEFTGSIGIPDADDLLIYSGKAPPGKICK